MHVVDGLAGGSEPKNREINMKFLLPLFTILSVLVLVGCSSSDDDDGDSPSSSNVEADTVAATPVDVSGNWTLQVGDGTGTVSFPLSIQQDGTDLSGSAGAGSVMGDIDGDKISLAVSNSGQSFVLNGTASNTRMSGQATVAGENGTFTATR